MLPTPKEASNDLSNSINQIVDRLTALLPRYGWEVVERDQPADLVAAHAGQSGGEYPCDIAHCHGLYPTREYPDKLWFAANQSVIENLRRARVVTAPSRWVADILRRDMHLSPHIIPWAVDSSEWSPIPHKGYTLWNKTRVDPVCNPVYVANLAQRIPSAKFVTTFYPSAIVPQNVSVIGRRPFDSMKPFVQEAALYLATTKETFGIGILEAMACGIPILGFRWGAVPDFVEHGVHGFLAEPGDLDGLIDGWHYCMANRAILGENARERAKEYTWERVAMQFATLYDEVYRKLNAPKEFDVSIIIPNYNYDEFLHESINSVLAQEGNVAIELIVVDDGSTDNSKKKLQIVDEAFQKEKVSSTVKSFKVIYKDNGGVSSARNVGITAASADYIICLDADDRLGSPNFVEWLHTEISKDRSLGIVYTGLGVINNADPTQFQRSEWPGKFDATMHFDNHNQIPTCCMFRKEAWTKALGYKFYAEPAEDAELWSRILALGYNARQVTPESLFYYRIHEGSLSSGIRSGKANAVNWLYFHSYSKTKQYPFATSVPAPNRSWPVDNYDTPRVTVVIPVAEYHLTYLKRALDSVAAQTFKYWECIVVNDTDKDITEYVYPWVKILTPEKKLRNAAKARNRGIKAARSPLVTFLDADDFFDPTFLQKTIAKFQATGRYVYTDWVSLKKDGSQEVGRASEYSTHAVFNREILHTVNILIPKSTLYAVAGFDEDWNTWEDAELFMKLARAGKCGVRLAEPLIFYDYASGQLREKAFAQIVDLKAKLVERYGRYMGEGAEVCSCDDPKPQLSSGEMLDAAKSGEMVRVKYLGSTAKQQIVGPSTKQNYGRRQSGDVFYIWQEDYDSLPTLFEPMPLQDIATIRKTEMPPTPLKVTS